jgi:RNA polymerase sigma-70 factor, ECF subfamily
MQDLVSPDVPDEDLLRRWQAGHLPAAGAVYDRHHEALYTYVRSRLPGPEEAEDVVQECFYRLLQYRPERGVGMVKAFLFTVARNLMVDALRRTAGRRQANEGFADALLVDRASADGASDDRCAAVVRELAHLPDDQKEAVVLKAYGKLTFQEIARVTGVSLSTAASRYRLALEKLAERLRSESP